MGARLAAKQAADSARDEIALELTKAELGRGSDAEGRYSVNAHYAVIQKILDEQTDEHTLTVDELRTVRDRTERLYSQACKFHLNHPEKIPATANASAENN